MRPLQRRRFAVPSFARIQIATKESARYDEAVTLLSDLRGLAVRDGSLDIFLGDLNERRARHKTKLALLRRINKAGLRKTGDE